MTTTPLATTPLDATSVPGCDDDLEAAPPARHPQGPGTRLALGVIRTYQLARTGHVSPCRFTPTCSQYAVEAVELHGLRRGLRLTLGRLGRCRPGGPFGSDPVPE